MREAFAKSYLLKFALGLFLLLVVSGGASAACYECQCLNNNSNSSPSGWQGKGAVASLPECADRCVETQLYCTIFIFDCRINVIRHDPRLRGALPAEACFAPPPTPPQNHECRSPACLPSGHSPGEPHGGVGLLKKYKLKNNKSPRSK